MGFEIRKSSLDVKALNILIYGNPGVGKTTFASTAPRPLFIDCEGGLLSIAEKEVDFVRITAEGEVYQTLYDIFTYLKDEKHKYETVVLDHLTELQKLIMDEQLREAVNDNPNREADVAYMQDWNINTQRMRKIIRAFRDLPIHTIFIAQLGELKDEQEGAIFFSPALTPRLSTDVMAYTDIIGYLFTQETGEELKRRLLIQPYGKYKAKDRSGKLGQIIDDPTFSKILKKIKGGS